MSITILESNISTVILFRDIHSIAVLFRHLSGGEIRGVRKQIIKQRFCEMGHNRDITMRDITFEFKFKEIK